MRKYVWLAVGLAVLVGTRPTLAQGFGGGGSGGEAQRLREQREKLQADLKKVEETLKDAERRLERPAPPGFGGFGQRPGGIRSGFGQEISRDRRNDDSGPRGFGGSSRGRQPFGGPQPYGPQGGGQLRGIEERLDRLERKVDQIARDVEGRRRR